jgi:hypothetical protein
MSGNQNFDDDLGPWQEPLTSGKSQTCFFDDFTGQNWQGASSKVQENMISDDAPLKNR